MDKRWEKHYKTPLIKTAFFLNPGFYFKLKCHLETMDQSLEYESVFIECVERMITDAYRMITIFSDMCLYKKRQRSFGKRVAIRMAESIHPLQWWEIFGGVTVELTKIATKILSLCCSASSCERNWSTFAYFRTKSRNRLGVPRLDNIVYVNYNMKLSEKFKTNKLLVESGSKKYDVIRVDELNLMSE